MGELHTGAALVLPQLASRAQSRAWGRRYIRTGCLVFEQERAVDQLDEDAAVLHCLDRVGDLPQFARRLRIGKGAASTIVPMAFWSIRDLGGPFSFIPPSTLPARG